MSKSIQSDHSFVLFKSDDGPKFVSDVNFSMVGGATCYSPENAMHFKTEEAAAAYLDEHGSNFTDFKVVEIKKEWSLVSDLK